MFIMQLIPNQFSKKKKKKLGSIVRHFLKDFEIGKYRLTSGMYHIMTSQYPESGVVRKVNSEKNWLWRHICFIWCIEIMRTNLS